MGILGAGPECVVRGKRGARDGGLAGVVRVVGAAWGREWVLVPGVVVLVGGCRRSGKGWGRRYGAWFSGSTSWDWCGVGACEGVGL